MAERGNSGGLAYESVRTSVSAVRTLTSGEQHRQVRQANKTVGLKRPTDISFGWVAERSNAAVLKTVVGASPPGVRIPPHPPGIKKHPKRGVFLFCCGGRMRTPGVRKQVGKTNIMQSSRYGFPAGTLCRGNPSPSASILGFAMNSTKIPRNRGIFHALAWYETKTVKLLGKLFADYSMFKPLFLKFGLLFYCFVIYIKSIWNNY